MSRIVTTIVKIVRSIMVDSGYTPTTAEVKSAWVGSKPNIGMLVVRDMHAAEFDRWLAANNAQVLADQAKTKMRRDIRRMVFGY